MEKLVGYRKCLTEQIVILEKILMKNKDLVSILKVLESIGIDNCYVGAGTINQTVFNYYHGYSIDYGIKDYDIVYYDQDLSYEKEDLVIKRLQSKINPLGILVDIKNEARVHLWYYDKYGVKRDPYYSVEDAIASWGATITCIGVRLEKGKMVIYAPYGFNDLFGMFIRPVKKDFTKEAYDEWASRWMKKWPNLRKQEW